eukprot:9493524-Pyramimonas_sp.AAC.1
MQEARVFSHDGPIRCGACKGEGAHRASWSHLARLPHLRNSQSAFLEGDTNNGGHNLKAVLFQRRSEVSTRA